MSWLAGRCVSSAGVDGRRIAGGSTKVPGYGVFGESIGSVQASQE